MGSSCSQEKFHYDEARKECIGPDGKTGHNEDEVIECGHLENEVARGEDFSGQNLKGLVVKNSDFSGSKFNNADLEGAVFETVDLNGARFQKANLAGASFRVHPTNLRVDSYAFKKARIDGDTLMEPYNLEDMVEGFGAVLVEQKEREKDREEVSVVVSPDVKPYVAALFEKDFLRIRDFTFQVEEDPLYQNLFGDRAEDSAYEFLQRRVRALSEIPTQLQGAQVGAVNLGAGVVLGNFFGLISEIERTLLLMRSYQTINEAHLMKASTMERFFEKQGIAIETPRSGVIALGPQYTRMNMTTIQRLPILIHEARHSDCPPTDTFDPLEFREKQKILGPRVRRFHDQLIDKLSLFKDTYYEPMLPRYTVEKNLSEEVKTFQELQQQMQEFAADSVAHTRNGRLPPQCGYIHSICPKDHPDPAIRGIAACDEVDWGAYTFGAVYARALARGCEKCSEKEKQAAATSAIVSFGRVVDLKAMLRHGLRTIDLRGF